MRLRHLRNQEWAGILANLPPGDVDHVARATHGIGSFDSCK